MGEDGVVQSALTLGKIPFIGCTPTVGAVCRDKFTVKAVANSLGIPKDVMAAVDNIISGNRMLIDVGLFGDRTFNYIASFGAFTEASYSTPQEAKNAIGHIAYLFEGIKSLSNIRAYKVKFSFEEGVEVEDKVIFAAVSNTTSMGGVLKLSESLVALNDGLLEVIIVKEPENLNELQRIIGELLTGKFSGDLVSLYHTKQVMVTTEENIDWTLDGERQEGSKEVVIKNLRQSVSFIVPKT
jgi:diacylglycerol kinase family enzyme